MAIVDFNSATWGDPWFRKLPVNSKLLFIYLWTNTHKTLTGIYPLDIDVMVFETGIPSKQCLQTLSTLSPKVKYDYHNEIVWVVNHVRHQFMRTLKISEQVKIGIIRNLLILNGHPFVKEFLEVYKILEITIPSTEGLQRVSLDPPGGGGGVGEGSFNKKVAKRNIAYTPDFEKFYAAYPRRIGKGKAMEAWQALSPDIHLQDVIMRAIEVQAKSDQWRKDSGIFIPYPATWLNGRRWEDEACDIKQGVIWPTEVVV